MNNIQDENTKTVKPTVFKKLIRKITTFCKDTYSDIRYIMSSFVAVITGLLAVKHITDAIEDDEYINDNANSYFLRSMKTLFMYIVTPIILVSILLVTLRGMVI